MRAHQAASSRSSSRAKCTRPLVVGPSPVITPSRTIVRACAAVSRQDGSRAPFGWAALEVEADISFTSQFLFPDQHFHSRVNDWLTIRNPLRENFRWLPICRDEACVGSRRRQAGDGVLRGIKGDIGASKACTAIGIFSPQVPGSKSNAQG